MATWILTAVIFTPLLGVILLWLPPRGDAVSVRRSAFFYSLVVLVLAILASVEFYSPQWQGNLSNGAYPLSFHLPWLSDEMEAFPVETAAIPDDDEAAAGEVEVLRFARKPLIDIGYRVGVDGISIWLVLLTAFLTPLAIWSSATAIREREREYYSLLLLLEVAMLGVFCAQDLLLFYVFFEFTLVPLYFLIGIWGGPQRRYAANKFFIFTLAGSVFTFAGIVYLAYFSYEMTGRITLDLTELTRMGQENGLPPHVQYWLFLAFAAGFAIKVPLFPVHTWLPLAHTEAPTAGSVILAGVLLKLGTYGFCRLSIPILPAASFEFAPFIGVLAIIGIIYTALAAWVQADVKKLVAYSSVSHLGFCMLGLFSLKVVGVNGAVLYMINHGLSTGALFLVVGCMYERYHTRDIHKIGGLARPMPWMAFFLVFFTLSSIGLPGLNGFVGELLVLVGTASSSYTMDNRAAGPLGYGYVIPAALGIILGAVYMLWMCQRVLFGPLQEPPNTPDTSTGLSKDLTKREIAILAPIAACCVVIGVYPTPMLESIETATRTHVLLKPPTALHTDAGVDADVREEVVGADPEGFSGNDLLWSDPATEIVDATPITGHLAKPAKGGTGHVR